MAGEGSTRVRLGDLVDVKHGWPFKSALFRQELTGHPIVVGIGNFNYTGGFRFDSTAVKEYRGPYPREFELAPRDTLMVMTCQTPGGEILGIPARVPDDGRVYLHNQRMGKVVVKDPSRVSEDFLYWVFLSQGFNRHLVQGAAAGPPQADPPQARLPARQAGEGDADRARAGRGPVGDVGCGITRDGLAPRVGPPTAMMAWMAREIAVTRGR